jgi:protein-tyrosine-phosphatase
MSGQKYIIEVACTGNNGRSPMAEVIGNHTAKELGLEDILSFISSGTRAGPEHDEVLPYNKVVSVLSKASSHGLMKPVEVEKDRYEHDTDYRLAIQGNVHMAFRIMRPIETALRDSALYDIGMRYDGTRTQTIARDDVSVVLGMEPNHLDQINEIYSISKHKPLITTLTEYAGDSGEIPDSIGNTDPTVYSTIRDKLLEVMPKVVSRFRTDNRL